MGKTKREKTKAEIILQHINNTNNVCPICAKEITEGQVNKDEIEYSRSKQGNWVFFHHECFLRS